MRHVSHLQSLFLLVGLHERHLGPEPLQLALQLLRAPAQLLYLQVPLDLPLPDRLIHPVFQQTVQLLGLSRREQLE